MSEHEKTTTDFDAAKTVFETLKGMDRQQQQRILRWVSESLGVQALPLPQVHSNILPLDSVPGDTTTNLTGTAHPAVRQHPIDIKTFTSAKQPKSDMQFAAVVAYYYRFDAPPENRRETINGDVLQEAARLAGRKRPPKPGMTLANAKNQGYLDAAGGGEYRINSVGENLVAMTLPGNEGNGKHRKPVRTKAPKEVGNKARRRAG